MTRIWAHAAASIICLPIQLCSALAEGVVLGWRTTHHVNDDVTITYGPRYQERQYCD